jgi:hypothetical protein
MIPGETVKKVTRTEGAVKSIKYRPSLYKKLMALGERLSSEERKDFFRVIAGGTFGANVRFAVSVWVGKAAQDASGITRTLNNRNSLFLIVSFLLC